MKTISIFVVMLELCGIASGTTYYVSSSLGSDASNGTSSSSAWQTIAKVNGQAFAAGDSILLRRGDVWNESLAPAVSGAAGNPITFDAYGTGAPPNLTGYYAVPASAWVPVTGNAWKAPVPAGYSTINFCLFGSVWGQKVAASTANLTAQGDFYLANGYVYIFSVGSPSTHYTGPIVPMALSNVSVINVNGRTWLTFQHLLVNWFDQYGVYVQGTSDHLVFANMEADSMIPQGTQPLGFYVNESSPGPGDIKIYNSESHMNYDGFRFDGVASAITMVNDKAYGNRDGALVDNTGAVTYSYCHFYASSLAVAGSTDVLWTSGSGPIAGAGNIAQDTPPAVQVWQRYPAEVTLTVDDAGMTPGADTYYANTVLPIADGLGVPVGAAITVGYALAQTLVSEFQGWLNAGRDVTSHSISHTYYTNTDALDIQYTGSGTAATASISGKTLTITVTGAADGVSYNLTQGQPQGTISGLETALNGTGHFTVSENPTCQGPYGTGCSYYTKSALLSQDLADISSQNVKSSVYHMLLDVTRLTTDEITLSRQWMATNLTGLPATPVYVYPGGYETPTMQGIAAGAGYSGARGALKEDLGVKDTYASGFDVENVTSFGVNPTWMGLTPAALNQKVQALVWKQMLWGVPWGIFWHLNELTNNDPVGGTEITNLMQDLRSSGATIKTNTALINWLATGTLTVGTDGNFYYRLPASGTTVDLRPTKNSPVVDAGQNLGAAYQIDINGLNQNSYGSGWEIGAHAFVGYSIYGQGPTAGPSSVIGGEACEPPNYCASVETDIVQPPAAPNMGGLTKNGAVFYDTSYSRGISSPVVRCTDTATSPTFPDASKSAGLGGAGDAMPLFNANSTLLHVNDSAGDNWLLPFNPSTLACGGAITANLNQSSFGSAAAGFNFGPGYFDSTNPSIYYGATNATQIMPYTINTSTGSFTVGIGGGSGVTGAPVADFQYGLPMGSLVAAWQPNHAYTSGQYVSYSLSTSFNNLDDTLSGWTVCVLPSCNPGGSGTPTGTQTINNTSFSIDGHSMEITISGPANSNALFYHSQGAQDSKNHFTTDFQSYVPSETNIQALEFDTYQYVTIGGTGTRLMFGTQCIIGGLWQIWNSYTNTWVNTSLSCSLPAGQWNHIIWDFHRISGDTSCTSNYPCMHYDTLTINGAVNQINVWEPAGALPNGWGEDTGCQFQIDLNGAGGTASEYLDQINCTSSQGGGWTPSYAGYSKGDIIQPGANNPYGCAFKLIATGTTGSTEPTWSSTSDGACHNASWGTYSDGTATWQDLGGPAVFTYQLTSGSGTSGSNTPAFVPAATGPGHPDLMSAVSDASLTWTNTGVMVTPQYMNVAGQSYDATRFCEATSTNVYGYGANYDTNGGQGSGIWAVCYNSATNSYVTLNTATGWQSVTNCTGGTGYNCAGGTFAMSPAGAYAALSSGNCGFFIRGMKGSLTMDSPVIDQQSLLAGNSGCEVGSSTNWSPFAAFNASALNEYRGGINHYAMLNTHLVDVGQVCLDNSLGGSGCPVGTFGYASGAYTNVYQSANPYVLADTLVSWQPTLCDSRAYAAGIIYTNPPCKFSNAYDSHLSPAYNPGGTDSFPICGSIYNDETLSPAPYAPFQGEAICVPTYPRWANGATPLGQNAAWRFTHEFNTGSNSFLDVQFAISQESTDGMFLAFSSDWNCTLGNTAGGSTSLCGAPWVASNVYSAGQYVNPFSAGGGGGTNYGVYKITAGGTSAVAASAWFVCNSATAGNAITDSNGVVYTCQGTGNGRGDVFVVKLSR